MDDQYVRGLRIQKKSVVKRFYAALCMLLISSLLVSVSSYAWYVLSANPEVSSVKTHITANGSLEIALGKNIGRSAVGDSFDKNEVTRANRTWGNLIDLTDESYGLQEITLRPTILNATGGAVNTLHPFLYPIYGADGRVDQLYANNVFSGTYNDGWFVTTPNEYGVRGIGTAMYIAPGLDDTFGPLSQRQVTYDYVREQLRKVSQSSFEALCRKYQSVLMAYCYYGTGVSASEFDLNTFSQQVDKLVSSANEELRLCFALLAAAEMIPAENYLVAMDLLKEEYPRYESVQPLVGDAVQAMGAADVGAAIAELRALQGAAAQLKSVMDSDAIDDSDGFSMEEIDQTVGLIFDLEKTNFSISTVIYNKEPCAYTDNQFYSGVISGQYYQIPYHEKRGWLISQDRYGGSSVNNLTDSLPRSDEYQDNDSRETIADDIINSHIYPLYRSLRLADLDQAIADLYVGHWSYWDERAEEYQRLNDEVTALEAERPSTDPELLDKKAQLQTLMEEKIYAPDDIHLETIRSVTNDTVEAMRQYTLWSIAYFACDGQVPDDGFRRIQEIVNSAEYIHPRTVYQVLCNYGVTPPDELTQMVEAFEKLEAELLFLPDVYAAEDRIAWAELEAELQRLFGTITHTIRFYVITEEGGDDHFVAYSGSYAPEDIFAPTETMTRIREEIEAFETAEDEAVNYRYSVTEHQIQYGFYEENSAWSQSLGLLLSLYYPQYAFDYGDSEYTLEDQEFDMSHSMCYTNRFRFYISIGVGSEDNFNKSGLTVRQTRLQTAQENLSYSRSRLISAAVNADKGIVALLMQLIEGQDSLSLAVISDYLSGLQQLLEYGEDVMYQAALAMAASDYANDTAYRAAYSDYAPKDAAGMIELLRQSKFDEKVMTAFAQRMELLNNQEALLNQSAELLKNYQDPETGALTTQQISAAEAVALLDPVLDTSGLTLYGYVKEQVQNESSNTTHPTTYVRTVLYTGYGSPSVQVSGNQAVVTGEEPVTLSGKVYLSLERSLSGSLLAFARSQVQTYTPPTGSLSADEIVLFEEGSYEDRKNRKSYAMGAGESMYTLNLHTMNASYALPTDLWLYTGDTDYISADQVLFDLYGYCIDLSFRTNVADSDLLLQTEAINRIYNDGQTQTDTTMGAGSYMEFEVDHPSYALDMAQEYMACLCVAITDTDTGYIYAYAALDMDAAEVLGTNIKAPLRLYDKSTGLMIEGDTEQQYICHLEQSLEKNLTIYVYLDGAKTSNTFVAEDKEQSMIGVLNLQFCSSADLHPVEIEKLLH